MENYAYLIHIYYENARVTIETNDVRMACEKLLEKAEENIDICVVDGFTGEVLAMCEDGKSELNDEWTYLVLGYLVSTHWGGANQALPTSL